MKYDRENKAFSLENKLLKTLNDIAACCRNTRDDIVKNQPSVVDCNEKLIDMAHTIETLSRVTVETVLAVETAISAQMKNEDVVDYFVIRETVIDAVSNEKGVDIRFTRKGEKDPIGIATLTHEETLGLIETLIAHRNRWSSLTVGGMSVPTT